MDVSFAVIYAFASGINFDDGVSSVLQIVAGFGAGSMTALYSEINRSTTPQERTPLLTGIFLMYHLSILLGPAINKGLYSIPGQKILGNFNVQGENLGGLVLAVAWSAYFVVFAVTFAGDLPSLSPPADVQDASLTLLPSEHSPQQKQSSFCKNNRLDPRMSGKSGKPAFSASREHSERLAFVFLLFNFTKKPNSVFFLFLV